MDIETVLVPVDGSDEAREAVEYGVAIADRYDAGLHALYVFGEGVVRGVEAGDLEEQQVAAEAESFMDTVRDIAGDVPVAHSQAHGFSMHRLSQHPGSVVLDAAEDIAADFIVIPREPVTGDPAAVIEKAAEYVLAHASQPVLSV
ncbi:universal stress protein [Halorarius halobius]|uniref:universal stress protein n=1 Tax=Halorarius halobius TaxID=2962671 RepID=UPI0020CCC95D|nr:universal stress protein [Halorarius halobius]